MIVIKLKLAGRILLFFLFISGTLNAQLPIIQTKFTADPAPLVYKDKVYLYTTHDEDDAPQGYAGFRMKEWLLYTSSDMVNWTEHGAVANLYNFKWADPAISGWGGFENGAWAPQCIERDGKFYLYCPLQGRGIGVLVADNPYGPFVDPIGKPLIGAEYDSIDPSVLIDDDEQAYLYWGNPNLWYVRLNKDMISYSGEIIKDTLVRKVEGSDDPYHFQEGPWAYKRNGRYYMAYATTCCPEGIGYAMSKNPTGPWEYKGHIMGHTERTRGNHPGIIDYKGRSYCFGQNYDLYRLETDLHAERRSISLAEITYNADGTIQELPYFHECTLRPVANFNPYCRVEAETMAWGFGLKTGNNNPCSRHNSLFVRNIDDGEYIRLRSVDFVEGASTFKASASCHLYGGEIEIRLDNEEGQLIGRLSIDNTKTAYQTFETKVEKVSGVHDLYLVFRGCKQQKKNLFLLDWWEFEK